MIKLSMLKVNESKVQDSRSGIVWVVVEKNSKNKTLILADENEKTMPISLATVNKYFTCLEEETEAVAVEESEAAVVEETEAAAIEETEAAVAVETEAAVVEETEATETKKERNTWEVSKAQSIFVELDKIEIEGVIVHKSRDGYTYKKGKNKVCECWKSGTKVRLCVKPDIKQPGNPISIRAKDGWNNYIIDCSNIEIVAAILKEA